MATFLLSQNDYSACNCSTMLGLYLRAELALSRCDPKERWEEICRQKLTGVEAILFNVYIGHNPYASVLIVAILKCLFVFNSLAVLTRIHADLNEHMHQSMMCQHHIYKEI